MSIIHTVINITRLKLIFKDNSCSKIFKKHALKMKHSKLFYECCRKCLVLFNCEYVFEEFLSE